MKLSKYIPKDLHKLYFLAKAKSLSENDQVHLRMEFVRDEKNPALNLKEFGDAASSIFGVLKADKKAGDNVAEADLAPYPFPAKRKVVTRVIKNWYPHVVPKLSVTRPLAYIIPADHQDAVETLLRLGVKVEMFAQDRPLEVEAYEAREVVPAKHDYLAPEKIEVVKKNLAVVIKKGDFLVACSQPAANLIPILLEPQSDFGFIRYWKFGLVPEKGAVFAFYRLAKAGDLPLFPYKDWDKGI